MVVNSVKPFTRLRGDVISTLRGRTVRILAYHSISHDAVDPLAISPTVFRAQMEMLAIQGVTILSASDLVRQLKLNTTNQHAVCLTFDDGFEDFSAAALPILREFSFPSSMFVSTELVGTTAHWPSWSTERNFLDWQDLSQMADDVEIGSHAAHHIRLSEQSNETISEEMYVSRNSLIARGLLALDAIAYPYGSHDQRVRTGSVGYHAGFSCDGPWGNRRGTDLYALRRSVIRSATSRREFQALISPFRVWGPMR